MPPAPRPKSPYQGAGDFSTGVDRTSSGDSTSAELTIKTSSAMPPGTYNINVHGTNGSVTHTAPSAIELIVKGWQPGRCGSFIISRTG